MFMNQLKKLTTPKNYQKFDNKIVGKQFLLGKFYDSTLSSLMSPACKNKHHNIKKFPKSKTRKLLQTQIKICKNLNQSQKTEKKQLMKGQKKDINLKKDKSEYDYEFYIPLNNLWCEYMKDLISKQKNQQSRQLKILRSDFHGAHICVISSLNPTLIGLEGIVIKETLRTFHIITKKVKIEPQELNLNTQKQKQEITCQKTVIKQLCIFKLQIASVPQFQFITNGNSLVYRPSDRIKHKFKFKKADKLNLDFIKLLQQVEQQLEDEHENAMDVQN